MKFGQELLSKENPRFKGHYIAYKQLKKLLKELAGAKKGKPTAAGGTGGDGSSSGGASAASADPTATAAAARFITELQREMSRINAFVTACQSQLDTERRQIDCACCQGTPIGGTAAPVKHCNLSLLSVLCSGPPSRTH